LLQPGEAGTLVLDRHDLAVQDRATPAQQPGALGLLATSDIGTIGMW
jgi:hypothetical protein